MYFYFLLLVLLCPFFLEAQDDFTFYNDMDFTIKNKVVFIGDIVVARISTVTRPVRISGSHPDIDLIEYKIKEKRGFFETTVWLQVFKTGTLFLENFFMDMKSGPSANDLVSVELSMFAITVYPFSEDSDKNFQVPRFLYLARLAVVNVFDFFGSVFLMTLIGFIFVHNLPNISRLFQSKTREVKRILKYLKGLENDTEMSLKQLAYTLSELRISLGLSLKEDEMKFLNDIKFKYPEDEIASQRELLIHNFRAIFTHLRNQVVSDTRLEKKGGVELEQKRAVSEEESAK